MHIGSLMITTFWFRKGKCNNQPASTHEKKNPGPLYLFSDKKSFI